MFRDFLATYFLLSVAYLALHLTSYALVLRRLPVFELERSIFLYHFVSAFVFSSCALLVVINDPTEERVGAAVAVICAHGIYSLTFLELWTLSQISYSREVLGLAERRGSLRVSPPPPELVLIGDEKKAGRLDAMIKLQLLRREGNVFQLTPRGRLVSKALGILAWLANLKQTG